MAIHNVVEPSFQKLVPAAGGPPTAAFQRIRKQYVAWEITATSLFYLIILLWALR